MKKYFPVLLCALLVTNVAMAGGLESGTQAAETFKTWFFGFLGAISGVYLLWKGAEVWGEKIQWIDFGQAIAKVAVVGGSIGLAGWAWIMFS
jgi:hypothetical protein